MAIRTNFSIRGMDRVRTLLSRMSLKARDRTTLHLRYAILAWNWVMRNFASEGRLAGGWRPLRPNTLAGRRGGTGRVLKNTGGLRASFSPKWSAEQASVGSPMKIAAYHEYGTDPYIIRPKRPGGLLRFKVATQIGVRTRVFKGKKVQVAFARAGWTSTKEVKHPGLPARRMLPREDDIRLDLLKATLAYARQLEKG